MSRCHYSEVACICSHSSFLRHDRGACQRASSTMPRRKKRNLCHAMPCKCCNTQTPSCYAVERKISPPHRYNSSSLNNKLSIIPFHHSQRSHLATRDVPIINARSIAATCVPRQVALEDAVSCLLLRVSMPTHTNRYRSTPTPKNRGGGAQSQERVVGYLHRHSSPASP